MGGMIPDTFGPALAPTLQLLDLSSNKLTGVLPASLLVGMPRLHTLYVEPQTDLPENRLTGRLPANMGDVDGLPNLRYLGVSRNALTGSIPPSWGLLPCHVTHASGSGPVDPSARGQV